MSGIALAQAPGEAPKPTPEHKKLGYYVGKWTAEGEMKPNPFAPAGKFTSTDSCEWFEGGFAVVCQSEGKGPMGTTKGLGIMSYSVEEKATRTPLPAADVASAIRPTRCSNPPSSADGPQAAGAHSR